LSSTGSPQREISAKGFNVTGLSEAFATESVMVNI
jgi:hypothetical protein